MYFCTTAFFYFYRYFLWKLSIFTLFTYKEKDQKGEWIYIFQEQLTDTNNIPAQGVCSAGQYLQINVLNTAKLWIEKTYFLVDIGTEI